MNTIDSKSGPAAALETAVDPAAIIDAPPGALEKLKALVASTHALQPKAALNPLTGLLPKSLLEKQEAPEMPSGPAIIKMDLSKKVETEKEDGTPDSDSNAGAAMSALIASGWQPGQPIAAHVDAGEKGASPSLQGSAMQSLPTNLISPEVLPEFAPAAPGLENQSAPIISLASAFVSAPIAGGQAVSVLKSSVASASPVAPQVNAPAPAQVLATTLAETVATPAAQVLAKSAVQVTATPAKKDILASFNREVTAPKESPNPETLGAAILQSLSIQGAPSPAPATHTPLVAAANPGDRVAKIEELMHAVVDRVLVTDPISGQNRELRIKFQDNVLPNTEARIWREEGRVRVEFIAHTAEAVRTLEGAIPLLTQRLDERVSNLLPSLVTINSENLASNDMPSDGRSRNRHTPWDLAAQQGAND